MPLQWRHNERDCDSNHQPHDCLLNRLFRRRSKKISKLRVTGLWVGNSPGTGEFPAQMASNAENVSIWWRHYGSQHCRCAFKPSGNEHLLWRWFRFGHVTKSHISRQLSCSVGVAKAMFVNFSADFFKLLHTLNALRITGVITAKYQIHHSNVNIVFNCHMLNHILNKNS